MTVRAPVPLVFLLDVDNTLLDNDRIAEDLREHLDRAFGTERERRYWELFEQLRDELGYADYLGALQRYRVEYLDDPRLLMMSTFLIDYPFADRLYPRALEVIRHLGKFGTTAILSDGDVVFQPRKVQRSGIWAAVEGRVLIYIHKEKMLTEMKQHYPAAHYVMVDDKLRILEAMKNVLGDTLTTIFPRQGHYAHDPKNVASFRPADITVDCIADLLEHDFSALAASTNAFAR